MEIQEDSHQQGADQLYARIIQKLNKTIATYRHMPDIGRCAETFDPLEQATYSRDAQINHLLSITDCLLRYLPHSPGMEQIFTNFLKDYIHLVNPEMPPYTGALYLQEPLAGRDKQNQTSNSAYYRRNNFYGNSEPGFYPGSRAT